MVIQYLFSIKRFACIFCVELNLMFHTTGRCYLQWFGSEAELVVTEPKLIKEILNDRERLFHKLEPEPFIKKILGDGLTVSKGEKWAKMRKLANHAFQAGNLKVSSQVCFSLPFSFFFFPLFFFLTKCF